MPTKAGIQYPTKSGDYWVPAFAGTTAWCGANQPRHCFGLRNAVSAPTSVCGPS
jgi:hypothetical protein